MNKRAKEVARIWSKSDLNAKIGGMAVFLATLPEFQQPAAPLTHPSDKDLLEERDKELNQTIDERDAWEECVGDIYAKIIGEYPEWSNLFGIAECKRDIEEQLSKCATPPLTRERIEAAMRTVPIGNKVGSDSKEIADRLFAALNQPQEWIRLGDEANAHLAGTPVYYFSPKGITAGLWITTCEGATHYCLRYVPSPPVVEESELVAWLRKRLKDDEALNDTITYVKKHEAKGTK